MFRLKGLISRGSEASVRLRMRKTVQPECNDALSSRKRRRRCPGRSGALLPGPGRDPGARSAGLRTVAALRCASAGMTRAVRLRPRKTVQWACNDASPGGRGLRAAGCAAARVFSAQGEGRGWPSEASDPQPPRKNEAADASSCAGSPFSHREKEISPGEFRSHAPPVRPGMTGQDRPAPEGWAQKAGRNRPGPCAARDWVWGIGGLGGQVGELAEKVS